MIVDPDSEMYRLKVDMESGNSKFLVHSTKAVDKVISTKSSSNGNFEDMRNNFSIGQTYSVLLFVFYSGKFKVFSSKFKVFSSQNGSCKVFYPKYLTGEHNTL